MLERAAAVLVEGSVSEQPAVCYTIEMGAHPALTLTSVLTLETRGVRILTSAESMRRSQPRDFWDSQRRKLDAKLRPALAQPATGTPQSQPPLVQPKATDLRQIIAQLRRLLPPSVDAGPTQVELDAPLMSCGLVCQRRSSRR